MAIPDGSGGHGAPRGMTASLYNMLKTASVSVNSPDGPQDPLGPVFHIKKDV